MSRPAISLAFLIIATALLLSWQIIASDLLHFFSEIYYILMQSLQPVIDDHFIRQILVVMLAPLLIGLIPVLIYWLLKRAWLYEYMIIVWNIWLVLITMIIIKKGY